MTVITAERARKMNRAGEHKQIASGCGHARLKVFLKRACGFTVRIPEITGT